VNALLEKVAAALGATFEQGQGVGRAGVLAQHDHTDGRM
jgi:hypothetical protein